MTGDAGGTPPGDAGELPSDAGDAGSAAAGALVTVTVTGPGRITSTPAGIDCGGGGAACHARFSGDSVVLATDGATTVRWGGACSGNGDCSLALGADRAVTAETFAPLRRTFDGPDHGSDACYAIAAGPGDSIVVGGEVQRIVQGHDAWAEAFDTAGGVLWSYELATPSEGHDRATGVVALPGGGALVAGTWFSGSDTRWNGFLLNLGATGVPVWSQLNEIAGDDRYNAVAQDAGGQVLVAGERADSAGVIQAWFRALAPDGHTELWAFTRSAPGGSTASGVAVDAAGDVVVVGSESNASTGGDGWIAKYSPAGAPRWSIPVASAGTDALRGVAVCPDRSIAVVGDFDGASSLRVYTPDGEPRWDVTAGDGAIWEGVAVDAAGDVVVAGHLGGDLVVAKYTPGGARMWQRTVPGARGQAAAIDGRGNVLVCGAVTVAGNTDGLILVFLQ